MEFHQLRYFCAIADSGGFSRAEASVFAEARRARTGLACVGGRRRGRWRDLELEF